MQRKRRKQKRLRQRRIRVILSLLVLVLLIVFVWFSCSQKEKEKAQETLQNVVSDVEDESAKDKEPEVYTEPEVDILMVGDILLHENVQESGKLADGTYNYDHLFANIKEDVQAADIAIANQEVILGGKEIGLYGYPNFNGPYEVGDALVKAGFNVILHATNHTLDRGKTALVNCMNFWKTSHSDVAVLGIFETQEAYDNNIYVYEKDGLKIAILNYTYGTNGMPTPSDMPFAVAMLEEEKVISDLEKANEMADFVVVCPHWGTEYRHEQSDEQEYWANLFLEHGVDLVIGTHPHYIQPVEMLRGENGEQMLVYYSLGNFINSTSDSGRGTADRMIGGMAKITVAKTENGKAYIKDYGVEPLVTQLLYGTQEITTYKLADYTEELAAQNQILKKDSVFSLEFCKELSAEVFGELY
ncbi:MAG: CapA family protein [Tyzzerella sp.]|nr:CapA family protein [Tyzzerella sp.]